MFRRTVSGIMLTLLLTSMLTLAFNIQPARSSPATLTVPDDYPTIQAAVNAANPGDTVYVRSGTYNEYLYINKALSLVGENKATTIIEGSGWGDEVFIVSNDVSMTGFTIEDTNESYSHAGIDIDASYCQIYNNIITISTGGNEPEGILGGYGIIAPYNNTFYCNISKNMITTNSYGIGILFLGANHNYVFENEITNNNYGVILDHSSYNSIIGNKITDNKLGAGVGINPLSNNNIIYHNSFVGNTPQVRLSVGPTGVWDDDYPSGGNYWSDYTGVDLKSGPNQNQLGSDGIGDTPYTIDNNNIDHYPLMIPWGSVPPRPTYSVTFAASGLRLIPNYASRQWTVTLDGLDFHGPYSSCTSKIIVNVPEGVYSFLVTSIAGYTVSPSSGTVDVNGAGIVEPIAFSPIRLEGIANTVTGVTGLVPQTFSLQQNFFVFTGNKDAQDNPEVYWCQNVVQISTIGAGVTARAGLWIWRCSYDTSYPGRILIDTTEKFDYVQRDPYVRFLGTMVFKSYISDGSLWMENSLSRGLMTSSKLVLTSNAYITCEFLARTRYDTDVIAPNFVIVGIGSAATVDFTAGAGTVSYTTKTGGKWRTALNLMIAWAGAQTGEKSTGLMFFTDSQGNPSVGFGYQAGAADQGVFFGFDSNGRIVPEPVVNSRGTLAFIVFCPVYIDLFDQYGNCVGYNATSGTIETQMDNAVWLSNQTILVFNPSGTYRLEVTGTDNGTFTSQTSWQDVTGATSIIANFTGTITENETQVYIVGANANVTLMDILSKTVVGQGFNLQVNATVADIGGPNATFDLTLCANNTIIGTQSALNLSGWNSTTACFTWNTTGFAYGNYIISACAEPVLNETYVADNNVTCIVPVHVGVPGDISGPTLGVYDGTCNMRDIQYLILLFNTNPGSPNWKPNADINDDGTVNMRDIQIGILNFNQHE